METTTTTTWRAPAARPLLTGAAAGAAVAVALGANATVHEPTGQGIYTFGFVRISPTTPQRRARATARAPTHGPR